MYYSYENYNDRSKTYTGLRQPVGMAEQLSHFCEQKTPVKEQTLLDAGCGTGNYMIQYAKEFKEIRAIDFNEGMLFEARNNLKQDMSLVDSCDIKVTQGSIIDLKDFKDESVHSICNNQVIHHLRGDANFADAKAAFASFYRVLKPGGKLVMNWVSEDLTLKGTWWGELISETVHRWGKRVPSEEEMVKMFKEVGFQDVKLEPLTGKDQILYNPELYFNVRSFIDIDNFKRTDSTFSLCTEEELQKAVEKVKEMEANGTLDTWFADKEKERQTFGQTLNLYATKPMC